MEEDDFLYGNTNNNGESTERDSRGPPSTEEYRPEDADDDDTMMHHHSTSTAPTTSASATTDGESITQDTHEGNKNEDDEYEEEEEDDDLNIVLNTETVEKGSFPKNSFYRSSGAKQAAQKFAQANASYTGQTQPTQTANKPTPTHNNAIPSYYASQGPSPIVAQNQKNVFDLDLDTLEEKPWRKPGVDITDYFNYGFNEDTWRQYCAKQVQLRLEQSMQGRIRVYESKQADQKIDVPPELLALSEPDKRQRSRGSSSASSKKRDLSPDWSRRDSSSSYDRRRPTRDQDDSVIQVLASGEDSAIPLTGSPNRSPRESPSKERSRRDDRDRRDDDRDRRDDKRSSDRRDDDRRRDYDRDRRDDDRDRRDDKRSDRSRDRDHRDDKRRSPSPHKRSKDSSKRDDDDRSKRRR